MPLVYWTAAFRQTVLKCLKMEQIGLVSFGIPVTFPAKPVLNAQQ